MPALLLGLCLTLIQDPAHVGESANLLSEAEVTEHFVIRYRPGSRAGAAVDRTAYLAEQEYELIVHELELSKRIDDGTPFFLFLYDDLADLVAVTGVDGTGGFSTARESHIPWDNDQTRVHEMAHILCAACKPTGDEERNMFLVEGVANAVLRYVHGIPVHSVAAYERRRETLPPLTELLAGDFYALLQRNPGFNGYDVGGSFMRFLLDEFGARRTMDYYFGKPIQKALGQSLKKVEGRWHEFLDQYQMRPELVALLAERRGDEAPDAPPPPELTEEFLGDPSEWKPFRGDLEVAATDGAFGHARDRVIGEFDQGGDWGLCTAPNHVFQNCMARATVRTLGRCWGVKLQLGDKRQFMVLGQGAFIYTDQGGVAFTDKVKLANEGEVDLLFKIVDGQAEFWIDGRRLLQAQVEAGEGALGIGVVQGKAEFRDLKVRSLD